MSSNSKGGVKLKEDKDNQFFEYSGAILLGIITMSIFSFMSTGTINPLEKSLKSNLLTVVGYLLMGGICCFCLKKPLKENKQIKTPRYQFNNCEKILIFMMLFWGMVFTMELFSILSISEWNIFHSNQNTPQVGSKLFWIDIIFIVFFALCEEIIFRGILLRSQLNHGVAFAIVSTSLFFALCHSQQLVSVFLAGLILGLSYFLTGSILYSFLIHAINNLYKLFIAMYVLPHYSEGIVRFGLVTLYGVLFVFFLILSLCSRNIKFLYKKITYKSITSCIHIDKKIYIELLSAPGTMALILIKSFEFLIQLVYLCFID